MYKRTNPTRNSGQCYSGCFQGQASDSSKIAKKAANPQILFFFMERFSNSRSWKSAMKLAASNEWFDEQNIVVILVGDYEHLLPATRLASEMELPFLLLADHDGALWRRYGKPEFESFQRQDAYVLVDICGRVQYSVEDRQLGLMPATERLFTNVGLRH